jgi:hypothetical protein
MQRWNGRGSPAWRVETDEASHLRKTKGARLPTFADRHSRDRGTLELSAKASRLSVHKDLIEKYLANFVFSDNPRLADLVRAMRRALLLKQERGHSILCMEVDGVFGLDPTDLLPAAIEFVHTLSSNHFNLPALRTGRRETVVSHEEFGEASSHPPPCSGADTRRPRAEACPSRGTEESAEASSEEEAKWRWSNTCTAEFRAGAAGRSPNPSVFGAFSLFAAVSVVGALMLARHVLTRSLTRLPGYFSARSRSCKIRPKPGQVLLIK